MNQMSDTNPTTKILVDPAEKAKQAELKARRKAEFEAKYKKEKEEEAAKNKDKDGKEKSKAELKAERRAKQEAQRATKAAGDKNDNQKNEQNNLQKGIPDKKNVNNSLVKSTVQKVNQQNPETKSSTNHDVVAASEIFHTKIFSHLPQRTSDLKSIDLTGVPPCMAKVGYHINQDRLKGSTGKCLAILTAFKQIVRDYEPCSDKHDLKHELQNVLFVHCLRFLSKCRPISIAMENTVKHLKLEFSRIPADLSDDKLRESVINAIDKFISEDMKDSWQSIIQRIVSKIDNDDTIMTLGYSLLLLNALVSAWKSGKKFRVVVVDTRPKFEGKDMLAALVEAGIPSTYCLISAISNIMTDVTRVFIEAHALMGNGYVMSHSGASQIALVAKAFNVQFIVCCETFKFSERVHTDSFVHNELGNEKEFFNSIPVEKRPPIDDLPELHVMDMFYDLTPHEFVTAIITEKSLMPSTSVPIILRIRESK